MFLFDNAFLLFIGLIFASISCIGAGEIFKKRYFLVIITAFFCGAILNFIFCNYFIINSSFFIVSALTYILFFFTSYLKKLIVEISFDTIILYSILYFNYLYFNNKIFFSNNPLLFIPLIVGVLIIVLNTNKDVRFKQFSYIWYLFILTTFSWTQFMLINNIGRAGVFTSFFIGVIIFFLLKNLFSLLSMVPMKKQTINNIAIFIPFLHELRRHNIIGKISNMIYKKPAHYGILIVICVIMTISFGISGRSKFYIDFALIGFWISIIANYESIVKFSLKLTK